MDAPVEDGPMPSPQDMGVGLDAEKMAAFDAAVASPPRGRDGARASDVEVCALDAAGGRFLKDDEVRALFDAREKSREAPE